MLYGNWTVVFVREQAGQTENKETENVPNDSPGPSRNRTHGSAAALASPFRRRLRTTIVILETVFVAVLLLVWLASPSIHHSRNLWVLFFFCFPSQFLITAIPHEPVLLYFGKFYSPLTVALVAATGTLLIEMINYSLLRYFAEFKAFKKISANRVVIKLTALFNKAPFLSLWLAGFLPIPFYPFRFMVVVARTPLALFSLAVITSRMPRFYLLAWLGQAVNISNGALILLFIVLTLAAALPLFRKNSRNSLPADGPSQPLPAWTPSNHDAI